MKPQDVLWLGFRSLSRRKTRAALSILMVLVGVASIIALVSLTTGVQESVIESLETLGPSTVIVSAGLGAGRVQLTQADVARISSLPRVSAVVPIVAGRVEISGQSTSLNLIGVSRQGLDTLLGSINVLEGSIYPDTTAPAVLIGYNIAFPVSSGEARNVSPGQPMVLERTVGVKSGTVRVVVSGVLETYGSTPILPADDSIFTSLESAHVLFNRSDYTMLLVKASSVDTVSYVVQTMQNIYGNSAQVTSIQQIAQIASIIVGSIGVLLGSIAGISLSVAALGIMNIMLVSVHERTHEIGILKALGFKSRHVLMLFLSEAMIIGIIGGFSGVGVGAGISYVLPTILTSVGSSNEQAVTQTMSSRGGMGFFGFSGGRGAASFSFSPVITPEIIAISVAIAVTVSIIAGLYPAWRASRKQPVEALRYE